MSTPLRVLAARTNRHAPAVMMPSAQMALTVSLLAWTSVVREAVRTKFNAVMQSRAG